jgi:N-acetylmuramoyl-L-alanine amidase
MMPLLFNQRPSPNQGRRPLGVAISCVVLHADASPKLSSSLNWILRAASKVSYHYLLGRAGHIYECVQPSRRAWHAGKSSFAGVPDVNDYSIGVCFSNDQIHEPFSDTAVETGARLVAGLMDRYPAITLDRIVTHAAVATPAGRKTDPGQRFPMTFFLSRVQHHRSALPPAA